MNRRTFFGFFTLPMAAKAEGQLAHVVNNSARALLRRVHVQVQGAEPLGISGITIRGIRGS